MAAKKPAVKETSKTASTMASKSAPSAKSAPKGKSLEGKKLVAAVLIRGREASVRHDIKRALDNLRLWRRHICVVFEDTAVTRGQLNKAKDLITYGPISHETLAKLDEKRGSLKDRDGNKLHVYRMHPPRGGWGAKGIKLSYQEGGCLGLRRKGMDATLEKMY